MKSEIQDFKNLVKKSLPQFPSHWEASRLRFKASINPPKRTLPQVSLDQNVSFIPMQSVGEDGSVNLSEHRLLDEVKSGFTPIKEGDVFVSKITPCFENGKASIALNLINNIAFGSTELIVLRPGPQLHRKFLFYTMRSHNVRTLGELEMYGTAGQRRVPEHFFKDFIIGVPPYKEQENIVSFLDHETSKIDNAIRKIDGVVGNRAYPASSFLGLISERKQALISAAVTGQIDVRDWEPPAAEADEAGEPEAAHG